MRGDAGIADDYWKRYVTPEEADEIVERITATTAVVSEGLPIHVRHWRSAEGAPTILTAHGLLPWGLTLGRFHLGLARAGFNIVNWDLPGFGLSGGSRTGPTIDRMIQAWKDLFAYTRREYGAPIFVVGFAEDGVTAYYALANEPDLAGASFHILVEYGDPLNLHWRGPLISRLSRFALPMLAAIRPSTTFAVETAVPLQPVFGELTSTFESDPLRVRAFGIDLARSMAKRREPPVAWSQNRTPIQIVSSERGELWPHEMNVKYHELLGGEKELVTLEGASHSSFEPEFVDMYIGHVVRWFARHGAAVGAEVGEVFG